MKYAYYSPFFSMFAKMTAAVFRADKQKNNIIMPAIRRVGIKFDMISAGKLYPGILVIKTFSWFEAEGNNEPSV